MLVVWLSLLIRFVKSSTVWTSTVMDIWSSTKSRSTTNNKRTTDLLGLINKSKPISVNTASVLTVRLLLTSSLASFFTLLNDKKKMKLKVKVKEEEKKQNVSNKQTNKQTKLFP